MDNVMLEQLLQAVRSGLVPIAEAREQIARLPFSDLEFAKVDHHRELRQGLPEVIFAPGKSGVQIEAIARALLARGQAVLITRVSEEQATQLEATLPGIGYNPVARTAVLPGRSAPKPRPGQVTIVCAGTSDLAVAEEARETLKAAGCTPGFVCDVGVAGLHRLLAALPALREADILICVAGMEGALASVVGGLVSAPVIAVPTSIGYGTAFGGVAPLLTMLNSCASGVTVVNIDNGFGAAIAALRILERFSSLAEREVRP
jgi:pyridinium-3,5-biscarboxylic acid mononucleotide synthase